MKEALTIILVVLLFLRMPCVAQRVTIRGKGLPITEVFREIRRQTRYDLIFSPLTLNGAPTVDLNFRNANAGQVLDSCFAGLQLGYSIDDQTIVVYRKVGLDDCLYLPLRGRVQNANGEGLDGASIAVDGGVQVNTLAGGLFRVPLKSRKAVVTVSFLGYSPQTVALNNAKFEVISLQPASSTLDNVIVQAYGRTTTRLATGSVSQARGSDVSSQPVGNVLEGLESKIPGMDIRQHSGVPGSSFGLLIRGRRSIAQGTDPLIVIDGMPMADNNGYLSMIGSGSAQGPTGASVLNNIPPASIASIEVLKDAAATAIYGSRGSNGVLLLTLKTGTSGQLHWGADVWSGSDRTVKTSPLLNTRQYLNLRKEAVQNDGLPVDSSTVPEAFLWDSNRHTDYKKETIGNTGTRQNARVELSGGDTNTVFLLSGNYYRETAVFPGPSGDDRLSLYGHLHHQSPNKRLRLDLALLFSWESNRLPFQDYTPFQYLAPNAPAFQDSAGQPVWATNGLSFLNIPALENNSYQASVNSQLIHLQLSYELLSGLWLHSSLGYYRALSDEHNQLLIAGQDPAASPVGQTFQADNTGHNELIEERAEYNRQLGQGKLEALLGVTWQEQRTDYSSLTASGYTSDLMLATGGGNPTVTTAGNSVDYRYEALFGRVNYIFRNRYIATVSGRRDGSSRLGPGNQFGNFWAVSSAWIFGDEPFFKKWNWLSFGKLRGSIGTTGNDQITYNTLEQLYAPTIAARGYQGQQGFIPTNFPNSSRRWEVNYSSELALDLGFLQNKVLLSVAGYRDWTVNQLIYTALASQSGLPGVITNVPARIINQGLECTLQTYNWTAPNFRWVSTLTLTVPVNYLGRFPELDKTVYGNSLVAGQSLSVVKAPHYEGVNPESGLFQVQNVLQPGGNIDPRWYGGCNQSLHYKNWQLDLFFEWRVQNGINPLLVLYQENPPGIQGPVMLGNGPVEWLDHWRKTGDRVPLQKLTASPGSAAYAAIFDYVGSNARVTDASYIRWKGLALSWRLPASLLPKWKNHDARVYLRGENLLTYTHFPVTDPETQDPTVLPPVRSLAAGMEINF